MPRRSVFDMKMSDVYTALVNKAEKKGRTRAEVDEVASWLLGYTEEEIEKICSGNASYGEFLSGAPSLNPRASLITGKVCGIRVEDIEEPLTRTMRMLDKLVDELAKGRPMERIKR